MPQFSQKLGLNLTLLLSIISLQTVPQTLAAHHPVTHIINRQDYGKGAMTTPVSGATNLQGNAVSMVVSGITLPLTVSGNSKTTFQMIFDPSALGLHQATLSLDHTDDQHSYTLDIQDRDLPALIITEIMFDPKSSEPAWEWLELHNAGSSDINLAGFVLDDDDHSPLTSANIAAGSVPSGGTAILYNAGSVTAASFGATWGVGLNLVAVTNWPSLANAFSEQVGLWASLTDYDNRNFNNAVDQLTFSGDGTGSWPGRNNSSSIYLTNLAANNQDGSNWALSQAGAATPLGDGYTSANAGGNSGGDIGSPGGNSAPTVTAITYSLESDADTIREGNDSRQQVTFTISRSGATHIPSQVDFDINGTATFNSDYDNLGGSGGASETSGTVNFAADETAKTITLDVLGDEIVEDNETIEVTLTNGTASGTVAYAGNPTMTTIYDDDEAGFMIVPTSLIVSEPDTTAVFTISLQSKPTGSVWINLASNDSGECSVSSSPQIMLDAFNWRAGVQVTVRAVDDDEIDGSQTCLVNGVSQSGDSNYEGSTLDQVAVTVTVNDDDKLRPIYLPIIFSGFISKPDLVVSSISATPQTSGGYEVRVRVTNQASVPVAPSNNFHVVMYHNGNFETPVIVWGVQGEWFGAGQSRILTANYDGPAGTLLTAWADPWNVVIESNEGNNRLAGPTITRTNERAETRSSRLLPSRPLPTPTPER